MKKCPFCAEEIQEEAIKCKHCGSMLVAPQPPPGPPPGLPPGMPSNKGLPTWGVVLIVLSVLVVLGLLSIGYARFKYRRRAEVKTTMMKVQRVLDAVQEYMADPDSGTEGQCPQDLKVLVPDRVKSEMLKDAWNRPLKVQCQGEKICVYSSGRNKRDENGGGDDIKVCTAETPL